MRLTKRDLGRRVTSSLLLLNFGILSGYWERVSGAERSFPGT